MRKLEGRLAVITGGGSGIGRELALALVTKGCHVALADVCQDSLEEAVTSCRAKSSDVRVSGHHCDVAIEQSVVALKDSVLEEHRSNVVNLLFNNAGIGGGGSFLRDRREDWERCFEICWYGVYYCSRVFMPALLAADKAHIVNTSSINGFWASLGPNVAHTAYSAAKFAVKGFTEALITDLRLYAPHVSVTLVMPGHVGTDMVGNSLHVLGRPSPETLSSVQLAQVRDTMVARGLDVGILTDEELRDKLIHRAESFRENAPTTAAEAAEKILAGVQEDRWRVLVGEDAHAIDEQVRSSPEEAYSTEFVESLMNQGYLSAVIERPGDTFQ